MRCNAVSSRIKSTGIVLRLRDRKIRMEGDREEKNLMVQSRKGSEKEHMREVVPFTF